MQWHNFHLKTEERSTWVRTLLAKWGTESRWERRFKGPFLQGPSIKFHQRASNVTSLAVCVGLWCWFWITIQGPRIDPNQPSPVKPNQVFTYIPDQSLPSEQKQSILPKPRTKQQSLMLLIAPSKSRSWLKWSALPVSPPHYSANSFTCDALVAELVRGVWCVSVVGIFRENCGAGCWSDVSTGECSITSLNSHA